MISSNIETITPETAAAYLSRNTFNRPLNKRQVFSIAAEMMAGRWVLNGEPIIFNENGDLANGQHRLHAIISAGKPIEALVVRGVASDAISTMDQGKRRTAADYLAMNGEVESVKIAAALPIIDRVRRGLVSSKAVYSATHVNLLLQNNPRIRETVSYIMPLWRRVDIGYPPSLMVALCYLFEEKNSADAHEFFHNLVMGTNLPETSPILKLRNKVLDSRREGGRRLRQTDILVYTIKAWNAYREGRTISVLRYLWDEALPKIV